MTTLQISIQSCVNPAPEFAGTTPSSSESQDALPLRPTLAKSGESSFVSHVLLFSLANLASLLCNGLLTFLLPRWLSMESYGYYRVFILYGSFAGALHLGLLDGTLVRWAARSRQRMTAEIRRTLIFLLLQQTMLLAPALAILVTWHRHQPWFFLASATVFYALLSNTALLGQFALQADKSFGVLSAATAINPALLLGAVLALHHWKRMGLEALLGAYLGAWVAAGLAVWIVLLMKYPAKQRARETRNAGSVWRTGVGNIAVGWNILLAGLITALTLSLDRIVVNLCFSIRDFAIYSLGATALAVVNTVILSISRVFFPYLSNGLSAEQKLRAYGWGESCLIILWAISLAGFFPLRALIREFLPAYVLSLPILRLLMLATGMTAVIYILHSNYFRSSLRQGSLLLGAGVGLLSTALLLVLARRTGSLENIAWAMLAGVTLWWTTNELLLRDLTHRTLLEIGRTLLLALACGGSFLLCTLISSNWLGSLVYVGLASLLTVATYGPTLRSMRPWVRRSMVFRSAQ